jgi:hypothetical protein
MHGPLHGSLVDHHMEGPRVRLGGTLATEGWLELVPFQLATFTDVGLSKSDHATFVHFITEREQIPPCPPLKKGGSA